MTVAAVVLGAGRGLRLGADVPKAHVLVEGHSLLYWSAHALARAPEVSSVLPVVGQEADEALRELRTAWSPHAELLDPAQGGELRQDSVSAGLDALSRQRPGTEWVLVHDAARPLVGVAEVTAVIAAARETGAALLVAPVEDTIKQVASDRVSSTLDRSTLRRALTPQAFRVDLLRDALAAARRDGVQGTDCASLVERLGIGVALAEGDPENFKVTTAPDLERAAALLRARRDERS